ncbi:two component transcriptional regulator, winged helix family [Cellulomonas flavigena DSM 20109]|uniref:Two component transcriptional regulator, winged helix family n=1 Tax=Cellulomonas flavigena (strain ATCC 482 / DSM 20109 / BCRC 11376 / JCM 18109 / NBRC 3775 / NCIMB 8073 / NRS 134) TaxID=446466 RepID=D5UDG7_CELFN|nr:winged helix-turn-helix domain-containing protein [Cellulomonas flavigena]ADG76423.1 two component transcriptional regulator, winged helix family [Cellulomonas flavigena DSM 20109]
MTRLLLVEDDDALVRTLELTLGVHGFDVHATGLGAQALVLARTFQPEIAIVDLGLPDLDGLEVVRALRAWSDVPVLVLSARDAQHDKVGALDAGADDYVTKPFGMDELLARLRAALRRVSPADRAIVFRTEHLVIDRASRRVARDGAPVHLTPTEWSLLEALLRFPGRVVSRRELLQDVWGPQYVQEVTYLRVYVAQLRRKLEESPAAPRHLLTEPGVGYRFEP